MIGDAVRLRAALENLIDNAVRHAGGVDAITVTTTGDEVLVDVLDTGPGFPAGDPGHRFDAFAAPRAAERSSGAGLGLGLHLVARIVTAHHGRVWAENRPDGGARVGFSLPLVRLDGPEGQERLEAFQRAEIFTRCDLDPFGT